MNEVEIEAKLLAHEAALEAMLLTRNDSSQAMKKFTDIWTETVRSRNKASADNAALTKALSAECNRLSHYFR